MIYSEKQRSFEKAYIDELRAKTQVQIFPEVLEAIPIPKTTKRPPMPQVSTAIPADPRHFIQTPQGGITLNPSDKMNPPGVKTSAGVLPIQPSAPAVKTGGTGAQPVKKEAKDSSTKK